MIEKVTISERCHLVRPDAAQRRAINRLFRGLPLPLFTSSLEEVFLETGFPENLLLATLWRFEQELTAGGSLLVVHMRKEIEIYPLQGDEVHDLLNRHTRFVNVLAVTEPEYRLDLFRDAGERGRRRAQGRS